MRGLTIVVMLGALTAPFGNADMLAPMPKGPTARIRIIESGVAQRIPVLQIPADLVRVQTADIAPPIGIPSGFSGWRDAIAGICLSLGLVLFGKRFFNRAGSGHKMLLVPAILLLGAAAGFRTEAQNRDNLRLAHAHGDLEGQVVVQIRSDIKDVILHLTPPRTPRRPLPPKQK